MLKRKWLILPALLVAHLGFAQENFSYTPHNPKPGDVITITYQPSGALLGTSKKIDGVYYMSGYAKEGYKNLSADELALTKQGKTYTAIIKTDTAAAFVSFGFSADKNFDNNFNNGYYIVLKDGDKPRKGAHNSLNFFYQYDGGRVGVERNPEKAYEALQKELTLYPESKKDLLPMYISLISATKKEEAPALIQKELEAFIKTGLKTEEDYSLLENYYRAARLPEQSKLILELKKQKFPDGKWQINETLIKYNAEKDPAKKDALLKDIIAKTETNEDWKWVKGNLNYLKTQYLSLFTSKKDWAGLKSALTTFSIDSKEQLYSFYNNIAWNLQKDSTELALAEELSRFAVEWAKTEMTKPAGKKPTYITSKQWETNRKNTFATYADTYAMILYRMGEYKKGISYAKEAALTINNSNNLSQNTTYALLAERALPAKQYKKQIEEFVKSGKSSSDIKNVLLRAYVKDNGSEDGFDAYITALQKESYLKMVAELRKNMLNETAPSFALLDMSGKKVDIADLKGKVVIADFWATWCGPCIASFPAMQKMVNKYKDNDNVKFVFINTWENGDDKKKIAGDYLAKSQYNFHVLLDAENKVVEDFKINGIPTKFIIDSNGIIRFKSVGYNNNEDAMVNELMAMIDLATTPAKTF